MIAYTTKLDLSGAEAIRASLSQIDHHVGLALSRIGLEASRTARREAPKFQSTLTNSIHAERTGPYEVTVAPGVAYAEYVHEGTGPAAGKASYMPPVTALMAYVKGRASVSFRNTKKGSAARGAQYDEIRDRAWALARYIQRHGTKPNRFMERTAVVMEKRAPEIIEAQMAKLAAEAGRA